MVVNRRLRNIRQQQVVVILTKFILHIGTHKTGTTAIQAFLSENRDCLLTQNIDFPLVGRIPTGSQAHRHFSALFRGVESEHPVDFADTISTGLTEAPVCILSSEDFWFCCNPDSVDRAHRLIGKDARVVCYLREPVSHLISMYKEGLKAGGADFPEEFINRYYKGLVSRGKYSYYRYEENLSYWRAHWQVTVVPYVVGGNVVADFLSHCGVDADMSKMTWPGKQNEAMSDVDAMLLMRVNRMLAEGAINQQQRTRYRKQIHAHSHRLASELEGLLVTAELDTSSFKQAFWAENREFTSMFDHIPDRVAHAVDINLSDRDILSAMTR